MSGMTIFIYDLGIYDSSLRKTLHKPRHMGQAFNHTRICERSPPVSLKIAVLKEKTDPRVAASPESVKKLKALGVSVIIESGAGKDANFSDAAYKDFGAKIAKTAAEALESAGAVLAVRAPDEEALHLIPKGALLICLADPHKNKALIKSCAARGIDLLAMDFVPRITRAQSMDVLSSQSNLAGYKAVLEAAAHFGHAFPMMMTAAGTIPPAKIFVMGAGVAGLQAIATARRLGAVVTATDVRPAAKEQVQSLGATFIAVEDEEFKQAETAGGYAKEMSAEYKKKQVALVEEHIAKQDIVITTALIPGRPAPELISEAMVKSMKAGSVIVDLAAENGGNCALSTPDKVTEKHGVTIIAYTNMAGRLAGDASALYARNVASLLALIIDKDRGKLSINWDDDILKGMALTKGGKVIHPMFKDAAPAAKPATKKTASKKTASGTKK